MPAPRLKRVYDAPASDDGQRILVDRLWPRGLTKEKAAVDLWAKSVSPSDALRHEFHGHPERWEEFVSAYEKELEGNPALAELKELVRKERTTLLYASRDEAHNNAVVLAAVLKK
ncbi:DUF488 domain-containing protein [Solilutibacter silvestris]|uniref:DUF488 domain-containing protein n=1 Tax=Solilutibacter silvestris TaxID=1645665 RepID=UPI003D33AD38